MGIFFSDANVACEKLKANPMNYLDGQGNYIRGLTREAGLSLYMFTKTKVKK